MKTTIKHTPISSLRNRNRRAVIHHLPSLVTGIPGPALRTAHDPFYAPGCMSNELTNTIDNLLDSI